MLVSLFVQAFLYLYAKIMCKRIKNEQRFLEKFENELSNKFILIPFDYKERLLLPIEIVCKDCGHIQRRKFYNMFKSKNCRSCLGAVKATERNKHKLLTKEEFVKQLPSDFNYEVLDDIINTNKKVTIKDEYGICEIIGRNLVNYPPTLKRWDGLRASTDVLPE